ncbi:MAG: ABC transporter substrate-binding protein [Aquincola sp.]|nr:ABC transporter substrate-binding protein [Aquincola sp.]
MKFLKTWMAMMTVAAALGATSAAQAQAELPTLRFGTYAGTLSNMPAFVADKKGLCVKHGFKCQFTVLNSGPLQLQAMLGKSIEVGFFAPEVAFGGILKGADIQAVVGGYRPQPYVVVVRSDVPRPNRDKGYPEAFKDMKGLKIGVPARGTGAELHLTELLAQAGIKTEDVTLVAVGGPGTALPAMLVGKQVEATINFPPIAELCNANKACASVVDLSRGEGPASIRDMIGASVPSWMTRDFIQANPKLVASMISAFKEADEWIHNPGNLDELVALYAEWIPMKDVKDGDQLRRTWIQSQVPQYSTNLDRKALAAIHTYALKAKLIDKPVDLVRVVHVNAP